MNKSLEAFLRGYIWFDVNGQFYWLYNSALQARKSVPETENVEFTGRHIFKGIVSFYTRENSVKKYLYLSDVHYTFKSIPKKDLENIETVIINGDLYEADYDL